MMDITKFLDLIGWERTEKEIKKKIAEEFSNNEELKKQYKKFDEEVLRIFDAEIIEN